MIAPRLIKLSCPECGAGLRVDTGVEVVTCAYCNKSSHVHWPDRPAPTAPLVPDYGRIHVSADAMRTARAMVIFFVVAPVAFTLLVGGVIAVIAVTATTAATSTTTLPEKSPEARLSRPAGPACERAVACCRAVTPGSSGCESMRLLSEADCAKQASSLATAARALGKSCR